MFSMAYEHILGEIKSQGKTQFEMAKVLGRTHAVSTNIFNGTRPIKIEEVPRLARWLSKSPNWILYGSEEPNQEQLSERVSILESTVLHLQNEIRNLSPKISGSSSRADA